MPYQRFYFRDPTPEAPRDPRPDKNIRWLALALILIAIIVLIHKHS